MKKYIRHSGFLNAVVLIFLMCNIVCCGATRYHTPVGHWQILDAKSGKVSSIFTIYKQNSILYGKIMKIFYKKGDEQPMLCNKCKGVRKDKPAEGMVIMWGVQHRDKNLWSNGRILDPSTGSVYRCKMWLDNDGKILKIRGYLGFSLLGQTQTWYRVIKENNTWILAK